MSSANLTHTWTTSVKNDSGTGVLGDVQVILGSDEKNVKIQIAAGTTAEVDCAGLPFAKMVSLFMVSDVAVVVKTNAADASGGQEIDLAAKKAYGWKNTDPTANPITANITKLFITNPGVSVASFYAAFLLNEIVA